MRRCVTVGVLSALLGCGGPEAAAPDGGAPPLAAPIETPAPARAAASPAAPSRIVSIPAGTLLAGSLPGTPGRRPSREPDQIPVELGAFGIDRHPFPNDPLATPTLVASRAEAAALCEARGARLCTELEWERACESSEGDAFPGGAAFDPDHPRATREGVERMGTERPEWTASEVPVESVRMGRTAILRGALADAPAELHRCASRAFEVPAEAPPAAFRCCHGEAPTARYPAVTMHRDFRDLALDAEALRAVLRGVPELAAYADDFAPYDATDGDRALARADLGRSALAGWELAPGPFAWSPSPGEEAWVLAGSSGGRALLAVLYPLPDGRLLHGASFVIEPEPEQTSPPPIAIARTPPSRGELQWSSCWGCGGEGGVVRFEEDATIRIVVR